VFREEEAVKANLQDQKRLLELVGMDMSLVRNAGDKAKLLSATAISEANEKALALSDHLIDARNRVGDLELKLKRSENDLELVENRIAKDNQRLSSTSSAKDAQGIEHELTSLAKRKSELEDAELGIMEDLETVRAELSEAEKAKAAAEQELTRLRSALATDTAGLDSVRAELSSKRSALVGLVEPELAAAYQRKADRNVAAGKLVGRECGACRLSITATNLEEIVALPADEIAECPNCQAYLVRL
jgi:predicted  nucleic acid-binding Zn-ribbon protein